MGVNMTMTLNPNGIGMQGRPGMGGLTPGMQALGGQPQPGMGIMAMMAAAAPPPPIGNMVEVVFMAYTRIKGKPNRHFLLDYQLLFITFC